jgi:hypothetical protein
MSQKQIPTDDEVEKEIEGLRKIKPKLPAQNYFNENIHDAVDAQIAVLEERMEEDDVDENYGDDADNVRSSAQDACAWLNGEHETDSLVAEWEPLVK